MPECRGRLMPATPVVILILAALSCFSARAENAAMDRAALIAALTPELQALSKDPAIIEAVTRQNQRHLTLTGQEIEVLRERWRAEGTRGRGPLHSALKDSPASLVLRNAAEKAAADNVLGPVLGLFLVTDNRDLPVAASDRPAEFQSPVKGLWRRLALAPGNDVTLFFPEHDGAPTVVAAMALHDPAGNLPMGVVSIGLDLPAATAERLRDGSAPGEQGDELQMWRPEELIDGSEGGQLISPLDQDAGVPGEGGGIAGDHGDAGDR